MGFFSLIAKRHFLLKLRLWVPLNIELILDSLTCICCLIVGKVYFCLCAIFSLLGITVSHKKK